MTEGEGRKKIRSYVLRGGRISKGQQRALETMYESFCVPFRERPLKREELHGFDRDRSRPQPVVAEIGFGMGDATAAIAEKNPDTLYIGIEVFLAGIGKLLSEIDRCGLHNVTIIHHDAVEVMERMIPTGFLDGVHIFFPDPWPKKKHHKRRLIQPEFAGLIGQKIKAGGYVYAVTDWADYGDQIHEVLEGTDTLYDASVAAPGITRGISPPWRPRTKFELKGLSKNHEISESFYIKR